MYSKGCFYFGRVVTESAGLSGLGNNNSVGRRCSIKLVGLPIHLPKSKESYETNRLLKEGIQSQGRVEG